MAAPRHITTGTALQTVTGECPAMVLVSIQASLCPPLPSSNVGIAEYLSTQLHGQANPASAPSPPYSLLRRRAGDPTDYCLKGGQQGVDSIQFFLYLDPADGSWCHDNATCAARPKELLTSEGLPSQIFPVRIHTPSKAIPRASPHHHHPALHLLTCRHALNIDVATW